jgi:hypothetical protein
MSKRTECGGSNDTRRSPCTESVLHKRHQSIPGTAYVVRDASEAMEEPEGIFRYMERA